MKRRFDDQNLPSDNAQIDNSQVKRPRVEEEEVAGTIPLQQASPEELSRQDIEQVWKQAVSTQGVWYTQRVLLFHRDPPGMEEVLQGPLHQSNLNNKQHFYAFCAAGLVLTDAMTTRVQQLLSQAGQKGKALQSLLASLRALSKQADERRTAKETLKALNATTREYERNLQTLIDVLKSSAEEEMRTLSGTLTAFVASAADGEVASLEELRSYIWDQSQQLFSGNVELLHIIMSGNMGPCLRCQARIQAFVEDVDALARSHNAQLPFRLDVNYATEWNEVNREAYGYDPTEFTNLKELEGVDQNEESYTYWSQSFQRALGT